MKIFKSIFIIINYKTFIVTGAALAATWACQEYHIQAEFPLSMIGIAIVFPVVFSIDSAYKRRERALGFLGDFKAHLLSLAHASRDWIEPKNEQFEQEVKNKLVSLFEALKQTFVNGRNGDSQYEKKIYEQISELSIYLQEFRKHGLQVGEMSRVSQYISKLSVALENMLVILHYRTPITLRAYSHLFIYSFPLIYAPYFVAISGDFNPWLIYVMPVIFSFILVSLDNIQGHLEDPFDQIGEDDIKFDVESFTKMM